MSDGKGIRPTWRGATAALCDDTRGHGFWGWSRAWIWMPHENDPRKWWCRYRGLMPKHSAPAVLDDFGDLVLLS